MIFLLPLEGDNVIIVWILTTFNRFHKLVRILLYPVDTSDRLCAVSAAKNRPGNPVKPWWFPNLENRGKNHVFESLEACFVRQVYHSGLKLLKKSHFCKIAILVFFLCKNSNETFWIIFNYCVWKSLKWSHLHFLTLAFSTNFCSIKIYLSGNTVWLQALVFKNSPNWPFLAFLINFIPLKM